MIFSYLIQLTRTNSSNRVYTTTSNSYRVLVYAQFGRCRDNWTLKCPEYLYVAAPKIAIGRLVLDQQPSVLVWLLLNKHLISAVGDWIETLSKTFFSKVFEKEDLFLI